MGVDDSDTPLPLSRILTLIRGQEHCHKIHGVVVMEFLNGR
jgi:hypothetical protein